MTSSFVARILEHADQLEQKALHEELDVLTMKLSEMEVEMHQLAEGKYVHFRPNYVTSQSLIQRVREVEDEVSDIQVKCNEVKGQLTMSTGEFHTLSEKLSKARTVHTGVTYLVRVYDLLETSAKCLEAKKYSQAAVALLQLRDHFRQPLTDQLDDHITVLVAMKIELNVQRGRLECDLTDLWQDFLKWTVRKSSESDQGAPVKEMSISVRCEGCDALELEELVEALHVSRLLVDKMKPFSAWFQKYLIPFVTDNPQLTVTMTASSQTKTLCISSQNMAGKKMGDTSKRISEEKMYTCVFGNLLNILDSLHTLFLHIEYGRHDATQLPVSTFNCSESSIITPCSGQGTLMTLLGQAVAPWLLDLLQKTVLAKAIPRNAKDLEGFKEVIASTQLLQDRLLALGFLQADNRTLVEHVQNIDVLFANRKSQSMLEEAHALLLLDLHDTVAVAEDKPLGEWPPLTRGGVKKGKWAEIGADRQLSDSTLRMPKCRISTNIQTLVTLAYETQFEATNSPPECGTQMFLAVRNLFELFYHMVPTHHGHNFESFPQLAALHHNNCMFIAHHLLTLGHQFALKMSSPETTTFVDIIQKVRQSGLEVLMAQINRQHSLLLEYLDGAKDFVNVENETNFQQADRAVRQAMLQLSHLQKVWKPVLPINIYKKALGKLVQTMVMKFSDSISALEDIPQDAAHRLANILLPLEQECGEMVTSPGEVAAVELMRNVPRWSRLTELRFILGASLSEIADRWADGSGPLADSFSAIEVKQMVRALFQNTDRRANLLARIK